MVGSTTTAESALVTLKALPLVFLLPLATQAADHYTFYGNSRFGFTLEVPTDVFAPQGESDNGDGQAFSSKDDKAEIRAYGSSLMEPEFPCTASSVFDQGTTTYMSVDGGTSVASGYNGGSVFYVKTIRAKDRCLNLVITYPSRDRARFDAIVKRVSSSFKGPNASASDRS
ncbi:hypothetical protein LVB87_15585 [Lysobacter sp. KIS68-7]|uniref:hypothetical protein n=1 Tax=Lysobacter sp. KIS68-7 TaxID=2904252 RepID=UPI001E4C3F09|nr:hypothetical protein [Lysobacter sp. KIS68-7]UHQ19588.1 hypothetical protein LVB87_15585 [Lysobacter sp. KIS68-7]